MDLPAGARTIADGLGRRLPARGAGRAPTGLAAAALLAFAIAAVVPPGAFAKDVPVPRLSPLKTATPADAATDAAGAAAPADDPTVAGPADDPTVAGVDDPLIPPEEIPDPGLGLAAGGGLPAEGDVDGEPGIDAPLSLAPGADQPIDLGAPPPAGPIDLAAPPGASDPAAPVDPATLSTLTLEAHLIEGGPTVMTGMTWRVFGDSVGSDGKMRLVGEATGGPVTLKLRAGSYFVHAAYGRAGISKKVQVGGDVATDSIVLNAGGMRLTALVGKDQPLAGSDVSFDIYAPDDGGSDERILLVSNAPAGEIIGLPAGIYHVVCRYGDANAVVRADIRVEAGKLVEAAVYQNAARLTLKLVEAHGGEALANTSWSVVTPTGEAVADSVGAFPSVVLAAGDYTAIAKHDGKIYERTFTVEPGVNRDVEVLLSQ